MLYCLIAIFGGSVGSFASCVVHRYLHKEDFVLARSRCDNCGRALKAHDMIPIISYILLGGKCRYCGKGIPIDSFLVEVLMAITSLLAYLKWNDVPYALLVSVIAGNLIMISIIDCKTYRIPDFLVLTLMICCLTKTVLFKNPLLFKLFEASMIPIALLIIDFLVWCHSKRHGIGGGDIKLLFALGLFMPFIAIAEILMLACIWAFVVIACKRKEMIAFGPLITLSFMLVLFMQ